MTTSTDWKTTSLPRVEPSILPVCLSAPRVIRPYGGGSDIFRPTREPPLAEQGLVLKWGDGSGTGTGGTTEFYAVSRDQSKSPNMELWMGVWGVEARNHSSNWKEARTVLESLLQEEARGRLRGRVVFYFTDNLVSYYVINHGSSRSPSLQELVQEIKESCFRQGCHLEIVHVPGTMVITQGTDGLSRGIWLAPERRPKDINQRIFEAVPFSMPLGQWVMGLLGRPSAPYCHLDFRQAMQGELVQGRTTIWTPPPECARQVLSWYLRQWVQHFLDSEAVFLIPRVLQKQWGHMCRYVMELGVFQGDLMPEACALDLPIPFVLLHIRPHQHTLRPRRMDKAPLSQQKGWHAREAEKVRGLC